MLRFGKGLKEDQQFLLSPGYQQEERVGGVGMLSQNIEAVCEKLTTLHDSGTGRTPFSSNSLKIVVEDYRLTLLFKCASVH